MTPPEVPVHRRFIDAFPYTDGVWTVRQLFDRDTGAVVSTLASRPVDPEIQHQMPEVTPKKPGRIHQILINCFNLDV